MVSTTGVSIFLAESGDGHDSSCFLVISPDKRKSLNKIVAYRCIVFLRNVAPSSATIHLFLLSTRLFRRLLRPSECVLRSIA